MGTQENSSSAGQVCEKCQNQLLKCLTHVEFKILDPQSVCNIVEGQEKEKGLYEWRGCQGDLADEGANIFVVTKDEKKPITMQCEVLYSECQNENKIMPHCTHLYYYELDNKKKLIGELKQEGQSASIKLKFNDEYLKKGEKARIPYYLETKVDEKNNKTELIPMDSDAPLINQKISELSEKGSLNWSFLGVENIPKDENALIQFFRRAISFSLNSQVDSMPASFFHIAALECKDMTEMPLDSNNILSYHPFDQAKANVYVLPKYEVEYDIKLDFGQLDLKALFSSSKPIKEIIEKLNNDFKLTLSLTEQFNGKDGNKVEIELQNFIKLSKKLFKNLSPFDLLASLIVDLIEFMVKFEEYTEITKKLGAMPGHTRAAIKSTNRKMKRSLNNTKLPEEDIFSFSGTLPCFKFTGISQLVQKDSKLYVERVKSELSLEPIFGGKVGINIAIWLIKSVPKIKAYYDKARGLCTFVNKSDFGAYLAVATDKDWEKKLSKKEKEKLNKAFFSASLVLYGDISFEYKAETKKTISSSYLNEFPEKKGGNFKNDVTIELSAGAKFKAQIWIIQGALAIGMTVKTGWKFGTTEIERKKIDGTKQVNDIFFSYFKGVDIIWTIEGSLGVKTKNEEGDADVGGLSAKQKIKPSTQQKSISSSDQSYYDFESAKARLDELEKLKPRWDKAMGFSVGLEGLEIANNAVPNFSYTEYNNLKGGTFSNGHMDIYTTYQHELYSLKVINKQLSYVTDPSLRQELLKTRFDLMNKSMKDVVGSHLPLEKDAYLLNDLVKEFNLRDEYIESLGDGPEADKIKDMVNNLPDENGRKRFCDAGLWGADGLLPSERKALETRIKKGEI